MAEDDSGTLTVEGEECGEVYRKPNGEYGMHIPPSREGDKPGWMPVTPKELLNPLPGEDGTLDIGPDDNPEATGRARAIEAEYSLERFNDEVLFQVPDNNEKEGDTADVSFELPPEDEDQDPGVVMQLPGGDGEHADPDIALELPINYRDALNKDQLTVFKRVYGVTPDQWGDGLAQILVSLKKEPFFKVFGETWKTHYARIGQAAESLEFATAGMETYLLELQQREKGEKGYSGLTPEERAVAGNLRGALEASPLLRQARGLKGFVEELKLCYSHRFQMNNEAQVERIYIKHMYRAAGFYIGAGEKKQPSDIAQLEEACQDRPDKKKLLASLKKEMDPSYILRGKQEGCALTHWATRGILRSEDFLNAGSLGRKVRSRADFVLKYVQMPIAPLLGIARLEPPRAYVTQPWKEGDDTKQTTRFVGFARPRSSPTRRGPFWKLGRLQTLIFPAPTIAVYGDKSGRVKFAHLSKKFLEECVKSGNTPAAYLKARSHIVDFVGALVGIGRALTPEDALIFYGAPQLKRLCIMDMKARAIASGQTFYVKGKNDGPAVAITPNKEQLTDEELQLFKDEGIGIGKNLQPTEEGSIFAKDWKALQKHHGELMDETLKAGTEYTEKNIETPAFINDADFEQTLAATEQACANAFAKTHQIESTTASKKPAAPSTGSGL